MAPRDAGDGEQPGRDLGDRAEDGEDRGGEQRHHEGQIALEGLEALDVVVHEHPEHPRSSTPRATPKYAPYAALTNNPRVQADGVTLPGLVR